MAILLISVAAFSVSWRFSARRAAPEKKLPEYLACSSICGQLRVGILTRPILELSLRSVASLAISAFSVELSWHLFAGWVIREIEHLGAAAEGRGEGDGGFTTAFAEC
jgi:hypothetical protein